MKWREIFYRIVVWLAISTIITTIVTISCQEYLEFKASPKIPDKDFHPKTNVLYEITGRDVTIYNVSASVMARTGSMLPNLGGGNRALYIGVDKDELEAGDIVTFDTNTTRGNDSLFVVHRIISIGQDEQGWFCITQGDNNREDDGKVRLEDIKGEVVGIIFSKRR